MIYLPGLTYAAIARLSNCVSYRMTELSDRLKNSSLDLDDPVRSQWARELAFLEEDYEMLRRPGLAVLNDPPEPRADP